MKGKWRTVAMTSPIPVRYVPMLEVMAVRGLPLRDVRGDPVETRKGFSMTDAEHDDRPRTHRRRKQAIAGAVGLAAVLGGGALAADRMTRDADTVSADVAAPATVAPSSAALSSAAPASSVPPSAAQSPAASSAATPGRASSAPAPAPATTKPKTRAQMIDEAKGAAAKADNVRRPNPPKIVPADAKVTVTQSGSLAEGGTLKVVSARADLTGQRELGIVADEGRAVGDARCTQNIRFSEGQPAQEKPTLLICWRTSAGKSVYTVSTVRTGRPSAENAVAALNRQWAKLG